MNKPRLLLINPNTSAEITESVRRLAVLEAKDHATIDAVTAVFGARYISSRASFAIAGHAVLDAYAMAVSAAPRPDAVIVGCFGDPGIDGLREIAGVPVVGFAESGMLAGSAEPGSFIIATVGEVWCELLTNLARKRGLADRLAGVVAIDRWVADGRAAAAEIADAARRMQAARVVIGGTGLIPLLPGIARHLDLPVIDPHRAAVRDAIAEAAASRPPAKAPAPVATEFRGLSPALERLLTDTAARVGD
jgi:Asp/Glu/hydantoin racemase